MNAGFTKIYSLLLEGLPIYDGRVGAALGYLARLYCEDAALEATPRALRFAWGIAKGTKPGDARKNRNPSSGAIRLPAFRADVRQHTRCNLMAAWLLSDLSGEGSFGELPPDRRMRAMESALFMIGFELPLGAPGVSRRRGAPSGIV